MRSHFDFGIENYVQQLLKIVGADIKKFVKFGNRDGENFVDLLDSDLSDTAVISEIRQVKGDVTIKLADKTFAMKELAKIFGFYENKTDSDIPIVISGDEKLEN